MKKLWIYLSGFALLLFLFWLSLDLGILHLHRSIFALVGKHDVDATTVWQVRFPRALGAVIIGAGLGVAGAVAQGIFRNPLAEPTLIGLSSGATLGTITLIASGTSIYGTRAHIGAAVLAAARLARPAAAALPATAAIIVPAAARA